MSDDFQEFQFKLNGTLLPQFRAKPIHAYKYFLDCSPDGESIVPNLQAFYKNYFILATRLNAGDQIHKLTGMDTRGTTGQFELYADISERDILIITEVTSVLKIGAGRQVALEE
jgi:hypothetical protein